jgi:hypothetical protein
MAVRNPHNRPPWRSTVVYLVILHCACLLPTSGKAASTKFSDVPDPRTKENRQGTTLHRQAKPACDSLGAGGPYRNETTFFASGVA